MEQFAATDIADRAEQVLAPVVAEAGYILLLCEWAGQGGRPVLWLYIDRADGEPVGISDCVTANGLVTDVLDAEDFIPVAYDLRVSSPGLERPLKRPEHFATHLGKEVRIRTWQPIAGRRNWRGHLLSLDGDIITVRVDGIDHRIPVPAVERARLVYVPKEKNPKKGGSSRRKRGGSRN